MVGSKIKYTCKNCGWHTMIREEWADLKPRRCMNKKCNTNFEKNKEALIIEAPQKEEKVEAKSYSKRNKKSNEQRENS